MTAETLSMVAGILLSLAFSYIPGLNTKFAGLSTELKRLIMLGLLAVVAGAVYGVTCAGWLDLGITCDQSGAIELVRAFVLAVIANQSAYSISPQLGSVREAKAVRLP